MKQRIISGCVMLPLIAILALGGWWLFAVCAVISVLGMRELWKGFENLGLKANPYLGYGLYAVLAVFTAVCRVSNDLYDQYVNWQSAWIFLVIAVCLAYAVFTKGHDIYTGPITALGVLYVGFFLNHVVLVDCSGETSNFVWIIFLAAFGTDIFAYFTGYFFGKKHIAPEVSPKKTLEGCLGGVAGSMVLCLIFGLIFCKGYALHCIIIGLLASVVSQFGDLTASALKRRMGIKDYSNLIPGHGGIMDRFDSVIFTAPFVYYYLLLFVK